MGQTPPGGHAKATRVIYRKPLGRPLKPRKKDFLKLPVTTTRYVPVGHGCPIRSRHYTGVQTVSLRQIRGTAGRCADFDAAFHPLQDHSRERWLRLAAACLRGAALPPVKLARVGDRYFVLDGHHRTSLARALGWETLEAEVTTWHVVGCASHRSGLQPHSP